MLKTLELVPFQLFLATIMLCPDTTVAAQRAGQVAHQVGMAKVVGPGLVSSLRV